MTNLKELIKNSVVYSIRYRMLNDVWKNFRANVSNGLWRSVGHSVEESVKKQKTWQSVNKPSVLKSLQS